MSARELKDLIAQIPNECNVRFQIDATVLLFCRIKQRGDKIYHIELSPTDPYDARFATMPERH